ncbi:hypothetical protein [Planococcus dechangensis]|uniref:Uncharacterized protein n=1 Tax=Planococcus dechangensis TaxID=1176255 RepID=A0ABV9MAB1_9BACL
MTKQRITVGYVELTQEEADRLFEEVKKEKGINTYGELQSLMEEYDTAIEEPVKQPLQEGQGANAIETAPRKSLRYIEVFNAIETNDRFRIEASDQN